MANITKPAGLNTIWSTSGTRVDPGDAETNTGWVVQLPPYQTANWIEWKQDSAIAHINQHGIPEWDAVTEYQGNLSYTQGSDGIIYKCLVTNFNLDPTNPLNSASWAVAFETYGSVAVVQSALTAHLTNYATLSGIGNTAAARVNLSVWSRTEADARYAALAGNATQTFSVAAATAPAHAVRYDQVQGLLSQATEASLGVAALATNAKAAAGTDDLTIMTPLKAFTVLLPKSGNLAGLTNVTTARSNLGLGSMAVESATGFLRTTNNLSDLNNVATARANLGLTSTAIQPETYFLRGFNNLGDVANVSTARSNLGLTSTATTALAALMQKTENLSGLANIATARSNLGLGSAATFDASTWLTRANNLGDLTNVQTARNNLGLGSAATRNVVGVISDLNFTATRVGAQAMTVLPNGMFIQMGSAVVATGTRINFLAPMSVVSVQITVAAVGQTSDISGRTCGVGAVDNNGFYAFSATSTGAATLGINWCAYGFLV